MHRVAVRPTPERVRRRPEATALYQIVQQHLQTFCARVAAATAGDTDHQTLPAFVERELRAFLSCGVLARGFCRLHCDACGKDELVAFSCKRRGFCPSCCGRRMADTAAFLIDEVLPDVPVRQWVLSLPHRVRLLCAYNPTVCRAVRSIFVRAVANTHLRQACRRGLQRAKTGAVVFDQRFDSAIRLDVHFHNLVPDGVFTCARGQARADFHAAGELTDAEVARTLRHIRKRVLRLLRKLGKLDDANTGADADTQDPDVLLQLHAAAVAGRTALGPNVGTLDSRPGRGSLQVQFRHGPGSLCADLDGFSLHAAVRIEAGRPDRLEHLIRYVARPPIATERLSILPDGRIAYTFKKRWRDGSAAVVFDPLTFLERLAALVPRPRKKLVNYFGVFAPAASWRDRVVPPRPPSPPPAGAADASNVPLPRCAHRPAHLRAAANAESEPPPGEPDAEPDPATTRPHFHAVPHAPRKRPQRRRYYLWSELLKRVFLIDALVCIHCGGPRRLLTFVSDHDAIQKILLHLGLPADLPELAPARPPPDRSVHFVRS